MSAQHTPGPWGFQGGSAMNGFPVLLLYGQDGKSIGHTLRADDALLITAAPDLLAALQNILAFNLGIDGADAARAAIAKATGAAS